MFCSGWLARANSGNSNPSMQYLERCRPVLARERDQEDTTHVLNRSHVGSVSQHTTWCQAGSRERFRAGGVVDVVDDAANHHTDVER